MPKYDYKCNKCEFVFEFRHEIGEKLEKHPDCKQEACDIQKVPSFFRLMIPHQKKAKKKPGDIVKKHIEETREQVKQQKKELKKDMDK